MDIVFNELSGEYQAAQKAKKNMQMENIINQMQQRLMQRNGGKEEYTTYTGETICLAKASYHQLLHINGEMNQKDSQNKMEETANQARSSQMGQNKYTPDNPYPAK